MTNHQLQVDGLSINYGNAPIVDSLSLSVGNEVVVLYGPSGCGKTTILKAILGITDFNMKVHGNILLDGMPIIAGNGDIGMVFQGPVIPAWLTVSDICRIGCNIRSLSEVEQQQRILDILKKFGIERLIDRYPYQLSGGQKQRVALATVLANQPKFLLMDEPTTFIDGMTKLEIWNFIEQVVRPMGIPTIIVSHDPAEALYLADRIIVLNPEAKIDRIITVPFLHPRFGNIEQIPVYFELKRQLAVQPKNLL